MSKKGSHLQAVTKHAFACTQNNRNLSLCKLETLGNVLIKHSIDIHLVYPIHTW